MVFGTDRVGCGVFVCSVFVFAVISGCSEVPSEPNKPTSNPNSNLSTRQQTASPSLQFTQQLLGDLPDRCAANEQLGLQSRDVEIVDLDGQNGPDILVGLLNEFQVWLNDGEGSFDLHETFENADLVALRDLAVADFNGDGAPDVFGVQGHPKKSMPNVVWFNDGSGNFTDSGQRLHSSHPTNGVHATTGDIDGDGDPDVVVATWTSRDSYGSGAQNSAWENNGDFSGDFGDDARLAFGYIRQTAAVGPADFDDDGDPDFVGPAAGDGIQLWENTEGFSLNVKRSFGYWGGFSVATGDIEGDGDIDVVYGRHDHNTTGILENKGSWNLNRHSGMLDTGMRTTGIGLADFNGDGCLDIIEIGGRTAKPTWVWRNDKTSGTCDNTSFTKDISEKMNGGVFHSESKQVATGDLDGDGDQDAVVVNGTGRDLIWRNTAESPRPIQIEKSGMLETDEEGKQATFDVVLRQSPEAKVEIPITSTNPGEATVNPSAVTFQTSDTAGTKREVTVTGKDDLFFDRKVSYEIGFGPISSDDNRFSGPVPTTLVGVNASDEKDKFIEQVKDQVANDKSITFGEDIKNKPHVFAQIQTEGDPPRYAKFNSVTKNGATLEYCRVQPSESCDPLRGYADVAWWAIDPAEVESSDKIDWGKVSTNHSNWEWINFDGANFDEPPVVIATTQTQNGTQKHLFAEVKSVTTNGASVRFCESDGQDRNCDAHGSSEEVAWVAVSPGALDFPTPKGDQRVGISGTTGNLSGASWLPVTLGFDFDSPPMVFATTQTFSGRQDPSIAGVRKISTTGFETQHCEWDEGNPCDGHNGETNGWVAFGPDAFDTVPGMEAGIASFSSPGDLIEIDVPAESELTTSESGEESKFQIVLNGAPECAVEIDISSNDATEGVPNPSTLTFTRNNYDTPQTVTVEPVDDSVNDGDRAYSLEFEVSGDPFFSDQKPPAVDAVNLDDDNSSFSLVDTGQRLGGLSTAGVKLTDIDGDGAPDLVAANQAQTNRVYSNDGSGHFSETQTFGATDGESTGLAAGDLTGDDVPDLVVANDGQPNTVWFSENGQLVDSGQALRNHRTQDVELADFDGDQNLDLAAVSKQHKNARWLNPSGDGTLVDPHEFGAAWPTTKALGVADLNSSAAPDIAGINATETSKLFQNKADGTGTFLSGSAIDGQDARAQDVAIADFNGDGHLDLFLARGASGAPKPDRLWFNDGTGSMTLATQQPEDTRESYAAGTADLDGDGQLDVVVGNETANRVFEGKPSGNLTVDAAFEMGAARTRDVSIADIDGDSDLDVAFGNLGANTIWRNNDSPRIELDGPDQVLVGERAKLNASGTRDDNSYRNLSFRWAITTDPSGGADELSTENSGVTYLQPSTGGKYTVKATVEDPGGAFDEQSLDVLAHHRPEARVAKGFYSVSVDETVDLDASKSEDEDGDPITYSWEVTSTPSGGIGQYTLNDSDSAEASFIPHAGGKFRLKVRVEDSRGAADRADVTIEVNKAPKVAVDKSADLINLGESLELDLSGSSDPEGESLSYDYEVITGPPQSSLNLEGKSSPTVEISPDVSGSYQIRATVTDESGATSTEHIGLEVNGPPNADLETSLPDAEHENFNAIETGQLVSFDASGSDDERSPDKLSFTWSLEAPAGSQANLRTDTGPYTSLRGQTAGTYKVTLSVTDPHGLTASKTVSLGYNEPPTAEIAGIDNMVDIGEQVALDASSSQDPEDGSNLTYLWKVAEAPIQSSASPDQPEAQKTRLAPDEGGLYKVSLTVKDSSGATDRTSRRFRAQHPPTAKTARDKIEVNAAEKFRVDGSDSDDRETSSLEFEWTYLEVPNGVDESALPSVKGERSRLSLATAGKYVLELTVTDGADAEASDTVTVLVNGVPEFVDPTPEEAIEAVPGQQIQFEVATQDPDGDPIQVGLIEAPENASFSDDTVRWDSTYKRATEGETAFVLTATDGQSKTKREIQIDFIVGPTASTSFDTAPGCDEIDCGNGETCHRSRCFDSCENDGQCSNADSTCLSSGRCVENSACERINCPDHKTCYQGSCFETCQQQCDKDQHKCIDGRCTPQACAGVECPESQECFQGSCFKPCETNQECDSEEAKCMDGRCTTDPCAGIQCPTNQVCYQGACLEECENTGDCPQNKECVAKRCKAACDGNQECRDGEVCFQGTCIDEQRADERSDETSDTDEQETDNQQDESNRSSSGCGCAAVGANGRSGGPGLPVEWLVLSLGVLMWRRRRETDSARTS